MSLLGGLGFLNPWLLSALVALPVIWWLLRTVPPRPKQVYFPATRILVGLENREKTPSNTPWWLTLIRMCAAGLIIFALAEPVLNPNRAGGLKGSGPVAIVVDNGWASGAHWSERTRMAERLINEAEAQRRAVVIVPTASANKPSLKIESPSAARETFAAMTPQPFAPERGRAEAALEGALKDQKSPTIAWLSDGVDHDGEARGFADKLSGLASGGFIAVTGAAGQEPLALTTGIAKGSKLQAVVLRNAGGVRSGFVHAWSARGQRLGEAPFQLAPGETRTEMSLDLPLELRNQVARLEIASERSAGAVQLLDARSRWNRVGIVSGASSEQAQPLLSPIHYIERALAPYAEIITSKESNLAETLSAMFKRGVAVLMLADIGTLAGETKEKTETFVKKGGVLVRFAGPRLEKGGDDLLPVALRFGGRTLGGALSWSTPQQMAAFEDDSPFAGLPIPADVFITRQVLADPSRLNGDVKIWARLKDGTPLVTAQRRGEGLIILFHVTASSAGCRTDAKSGECRLAADSDWSNLPISGLFVDMLQRIAAMAKLSGPTDAGGTPTNVVEEDNVATDSAQLLTPLQTLDGFGLLRPPPALAQAVPLADFTKLTPSATHPPGYYGPQGAARSLNLFGPKAEIKPLPPLPAGAEVRAYEGSASQPLKPTLFALALGLLFLDILAVVLLQLGGLGALFVRGAAARGGVALLALAVIAGTPVQRAEAQSYWGSSPYQQPPAQNRPAPDPGLNAKTPEDAAALRGTIKSTFAYVLTGDEVTDRTSRQGLVSLNRILVQRTSVDPGLPAGVDPVKDELAFYPILYWPVLAEARALPGPVLAKIDAYMKEGGMIVFDTRDSGQTVLGNAGAGGNGPGAAALQRLLGNLDVPRLEPVPANHVLTKSFYLLQAFPGRWESGPLWVEAEGDNGADDARRSRHADGVSSLLVTANDLAAAWAADDRGRPLYPVVPGGEHQREMAYRVGVNIAMYALTGNYKADQVHVPAILERLGQ